jgi:outer membrane protein OmpA-like peptidoglycan-associated protein
MISVRALLAAILLASPAAVAVAVTHALPPPTEAAASLEFITLSPVLFPANADSLDDAAASRLEEIALFLRHRPRVSRIVLTGHADIAADGEYDESLAWRRAETVRSQLLELGVPPRLLHVTARGQSDPVDDNGSAAGRSRNQRVDIYVIVR